MPYATRKMLEFMKQKHAEQHDESPPSNDDSKDDSSAHTDVVSAQSDPKTDARKIRELPSSVDPPSDEETAAAPAEKDQKKSARAAAGGKSSKSRKKAGTSSSRSSSKASKKSKKSTKSEDGSSVKADGSVSGKKQSQQQKGARTVSASEMALQPVAVPGMNYGDMSFDEKKIAFIQTLLKSGVKKLKATLAAEKAEARQAEFKKYTIDESKPLPWQPHSARALYETTHAAFPKECLLVCKQYPATGEYDPKSSLYLKVLRHLGKKHPHIIQTWDIFVKGGNTIYVIQELAPYGNMYEYVSKKGALSEDQTKDVARQLNTALDYLGDIGLAHRAIKPSHVLLTKSTELRIKMTGFRSAIIYYDDKRHDINFQPCIKLDKKQKQKRQQQGEEMDFQAPETYGNPTKEKFDPLPADVWSLGATLYYFLCKKYPYEKESSKMENEIQKNVLALKVSKNGHSSLGYMLTTESTKRISMDKFRDHPWLK